MLKINKSLRKIIIQVRMIICSISKTSIYKTVLTEKLFSENTHLQCGSSGLLSSS
ncbi:unnamed protein product [Moneuplotes crassus]|uniref:Uncharacterized protein n=1 Tax=Euplotes crassus TaxID=5936 RepID=A0AAD1XGP0_EUPCR|nr:unnamed protein product [Moneuplotes crassus]